MSAPEHTPHIRHQPGFKSVQDGFWCHRAVLIVAWSGRLRGRKRKVRKDRPRSVSEEASLAVYVAGMKVQLIDKRMTARQRERHMSKQRIQDKIDSPRRHAPWRPLPSADSLPARKAPPDPCTVILRRFGALIDPDSCITFQFVVLALSLSGTSK